jgi:hypothetical protein
VVATGDVVVKSCDLCVSSHPWDDCDRE